MNTPPSPVTIQLDSAKEYINNHLDECCDEILDWKRTGILVNGRVRNVARLLTDPVFSGNALNHVEHIIVECAMKHVVSNSKSKVV